MSYVKEFSKPEIDNRQFSTLDLAGFDSFTLIVYSFEDWISRFEESKKLAHASKVQLQLWSVDHDFEFVDEKQRQLFDNEAGFSRGCGLLVRPDQHLLGCLDQKMTAEDIVSLIRSHLGE